MSRNYFCYFKLLIWKNFLIKIRHKKEFFFEIFVPVWFCFILLILRYLIAPTKINTPTIFEPCEINTLTLFEKHLPPKPPLLREINYTPMNPLLEKIVSDAAMSLGIGWRGFATEQGLETFMLTNNSFAGVVFDPKLAFATGYSSHFNYTMRFPAGLRTAEKFSEFSTWMTRNLFAMIRHQGPRNKNDSDGGVPSGYIREGFIAVQNALATSFLKLAANRSVELPKMMLRRYPHAPYVRDTLMLALQSLAAIIIILSFVYPCMQAIKCVTMEKEAQLKEAMKIMGLTTTLNWSAWFFTLWTCLVLTVLFIICVVKVPWFLDFTTAVIPQTDWTLLLAFLTLFAATTISFCFMITAFFTSANVAAAVGGLMFFISYIPYSFTIGHFDTMSLGVKLALCLSFNTSLAFGFRLMMIWESVGVGAQWHNLMKTVTIEQNLCMGHVMGMMLLDCIAHMLVALYVEKVMPGMYGVPERWNFFCRRGFWYPRRITFVETHELEAADPEKFEAEDANYSVGIRVIKLAKKFGSKTVVDKLSMNMYEGQITVLLGHNGAGKTTTISMITGLIPQNSGRVIVNGLDTQQNMRKVRQSLGYCPQHNILFEELTVSEHIEFYSRLKGFNKTQVKDEVTKYLKLLDIEEKRNAKAGTLSGGMKRKLSICMALCGNSKVVLCDEPSSGMDPAARRSLWDLLLAEKRGRTILLTTHFMDEADVLGDRIAIMSAGKLICSGTPFFLKKKFGAGYQLICSKGPRCKSQKVTEILKKYIPEVEVKSEVGQELSYQLPEKYVRVFEAMLKDLESALGELDLHGYGISMTTLEDVFMRTGSDTMELMYNVSSSNNTSISLTSDSTSLYLSEKDSSSIIGSPASNIKIVTGMKRLEYQWRAMFLKKFYYFIRKWYIFLIQLLVPLVFLVLSVYIAKSMNLNAKLPAVELVPKLYGHTTILLESSATPNSKNGKLAKAYEKIIRINGMDQQLIKTKKPMINEILSFERENMQSVDSKFMVAASFEENQVTGWFNNEALHAAPITLNMILNAIARVVLGEDSSIHITNYPLPYHTDFRIRRLRSTGGLGFQLALNTAFAMSVVSAMFILFPISERYSRAKLLQFVSGVRVGTFWLTHFIWDFITYLFISIFMTLVMYPFQQEGFSTVDDLQRTFVVFLLYGFASLPFTYLVSFMYDEPAAGLSRLAIYNVFTGNALYLIVFILSLPVIGLTDTADILQNIFLIFPNYGLAQALANQATIATTQSICKTAQEILNVNMEVICALLAAECCELQPYGYKNPGIGKILIYMVLAGVFFIFLVFCVEFFQRSLFKKLTNHIMRPSLKKYPENEIQDDDVMRERKKVAAMTTSDISDHNLVMRQVTKFYKKFLAVDRISLAIERGECFGLLGTNGAGKTSTFRMLTGDEHISYGNIWVNGYNTKNKMNVVYEMVGYCPQFDSLFMDLTGSETLKIYSLLRGIPMQHINPLVQLLSKELAFQKHLNKKVVAYSGGNRRKLSTAVAILGNPYVIYLDEPTTGIDPASRRKLWDTICYVRDLGKGIILTSHSMEECEALCTRIAIMVNGELKCLGSTQHLKNKFSKGISLMVKVKEMEHRNGFYDQNKRRSTAETLRPELGLGKYGRDVYNFVIQQFHGATLKDYHKNLLTFDIPSRIMAYSRIFGLMEANKAQLHIEDYSLSQTTLEQVFLDFAQRQRQEKENRRT